MTPEYLDSLTGVRSLTVTNDSGEDLPAHAAVVVSSSDDAGGFSVTKPTIAGQHVWISLRAALDGDETQAVNEFPVEALYDAADGVPAVGEIWGADAGSWKLRKGQSGFRVCGTADETLGLVPVERQPIGAAPTSDACNRWLRVPKCGTLSITEILGACGCVPTPQTAALTRNSAGALTSTDLIYGCPPGVTTATFCAGGSAPRRYSFSLAGLTGDCSVMNGGWTIAYTTGNTWVGTKGGYTATLTFSASGSDGTLTFTDATDTEVLVYTIENANCCSTITTFERDTWTCDDPPASVTLTPATACGAGASYTPIFDHDTTGNIRRPRFRLRPTAGSGAADILFGDGVCGIDGNGKPYIEFSTSDAKFCTGDAEACGDHKVTFRITCTACANVDYTGPGWYCTGLGTCQQFTSDPGDGVELVDGPFATAPPSPIPA